MRGFFWKYKTQKTVLLAAALLVYFSELPAQKITPPSAKAAISAKVINPTTVELLYSDDQRLTFDFYGDNIFRLFQDNNGGTIRKPEAKPEAVILVDNPRRAVSKLSLDDNGQTITIGTGSLTISIDKKSTLLQVVDNRTNKLALQSLEPIIFEKNKVSLALKENPDEYFYGGGVQNGRFSHKGKAISIENQNSWTDGGVASPNPFYWSTKGYGVLWHTFTPGKYDFGAKEKGIVRISHQTDYLDAFFMVDAGAVALLHDFYQLTGHPVLLPKFGFYEGHLNAYNRDYWTKDDKGILFEDGNRYKESQKDNGGTKESLNGEKSNYQFSARAVIDRYKKNDMPLGWILPNDGYGAGYGQTGTLDSNIQNLKSFGDYARKNGVQIGLWTQSDLHPKVGVSALLQRDIVKEVRDAGVRVLKTDVAWVGAGYSFGLNGVADVGHIMPYYGSDARPFIISLDGWAGTQRYAAIWSGDQTGGVWEYIRFHIPTYIGSGLSGQPNITSDMDGIFGGKNQTVNIRDFQWKTFTPMQLNMDGWGANEKYPHALGEPASSINRTYLKLKSSLLPYTYSVAKEAVDGLPIIRATFLADSNAYTLGKATQYQYLYGPNLLIAPIYQATKPDTLGNDVRNGIYLPKGVWIDYFTGEKYEGNMVLNSFAAPIWKLPVFVKSGAIIPLVNPNNNVTEINKSNRIYEVYPAGNSSFTEYDDDGTTEAYKYGKGATTLITSNVAQNKAILTVQPTQADFDGFVRLKSTEFIINVTAKPTKVTAAIGKTAVKLTEAKSATEFSQRNNVYLYDAKPELNKFATAGSTFAKLSICKNPQLRVKLEKADITTNKTTVVVDGFKFSPADRQRIATGKLTAPTTANIPDSNAKAYSLQPTWTPVRNADYYEIAFNNLNYTTIKDTTLLFDGLTPETAYQFQIRAANKDGYSDWKAFGAKTKNNPLEYAIKGIAAQSTATDQEGFEISRLVNFDDGDDWHTEYGKKAVPFDITIDLRSVNQLDRLEYLPRTSGRNGIIQSGNVSYSLDKENWTEAGTFEWAKNNQVKTFNFASHPTVRYIKFSVTQSVGDYGSGRELYVFKVPGTESYVPGDINNDHQIDQNDLTSYINYTGLKLGDGDFEGYVSNGDINKNNIIDAYDISVVATQLDGGVEAQKEGKVAGAIWLQTAKQSYGKDEIVEIVVKGENLKNVNALSFALPYSEQDYTFVGVQSLHTQKMENMTNDRLHTNREKVLYPTFVNVGDQATLDGNQDLFILKFKAKHNLTFNLKAVNGLLVDKSLDAVHF